MDYVINFSAKDNLSQTAKNVEKSLAGINDEASKAGQSVKSYDEFAKKFQDITESSKPLKSQLNSLRKLMAEMNYQGFDGGLLTTIAERAGEMKDAISDADDSIKRFASDTSTLEAGIQTFQLGIAGANVFTGAMGLLGVESDKTAKMILKVQSALAMLNGVQQIANALNKNSALMERLKAVALKVSTAAKNANNASETAGIALERTDNALKTKNIALTAADTAKTVASTAAQNSWNIAKAVGKALLGDWTGLLIVAVAGIIAYSMATAASTDELDKQNKALEEAKKKNEEYKRKQDELVASAAAVKVRFMELQSQYKMLSTEAEKTKWIKDNKAAFEGLGISINSVKVAEDVFINNTSAVIKALLDRAVAAKKAEQAADEYIKLEKEIKREATYAKVSSGQGISKREAQAAGLGEGDYRNRMNGVDVDLTDSGARKVNDYRAQQAINKAQQDNIKIRKRQQAVEEEYTNSLKEQIQAEQTLTNLGDAQGRIKELAQIQLEISKGAGSVTSHTNSINNNVQRTLNTLEGCDAIIQDAERDMKKLDRTTSNYASEVNRLKGVIKNANIAKFNLIDRTTLKGLSDARKTAQDIVNSLEPGTDEFDEWNKKLQDTNKEAYELAKKLSVNGDLQSLKGVQSALNVIIDQIPEGSKDLEKWVGLWGEVNDKIVRATRHIDDLKKGIEKGSIADLQNQINQINETLTNKNLTPEIRLKLHTEKADLQFQLNELTKGEYSISIVPEVEFNELGTNEDLAKSMDAARTYIENLKRQYEDGIIDEEMLRKELYYMNDVILQLGEQTGRDLKPIKVHIEADWEKFADQAEDALGKVQTIVSMADAFDSLSKSIEDGANAWDIFSSALSAANSVLQTYTVIMEIVQSLRDAHLLTTMKENAALVTQGISTEAAAAAEQTKADTDAETTASAAATVAALKAQESAYLSVAAASIYAAHAAIPFAGVGIASGLIQQMMEGMATMKAELLAMQAFAEGGVVGGSKYEHPILAHRGEVIFNERQQKNLFDLVDQNRLGGTGMPMGVIGRIRGTDIELVLSNLNKNKKTAGTSLRIR